MSVTNSSVAVVLLAANIPDCISYFRTDFYGSSNKESLSAQIVPDIYALLRLCPAPDGERVFYEDYAIFLADLLTFLLCR